MSCLDCADTGRSSESAEKWQAAGLDFALVNEIAGDAVTAAHLLECESVHGRWSTDVEVRDGMLSIAGRAVAYSAAGSPGEVDWAAAGVEVVLECSGKFRTIDSLAPYFEQGVRKVIVAAPVRPIVSSSAVPRRMSPAPSNNRTEALTRGRFVFIGTRFNQPLMTPGRRLSARGD